MSLELPLPGSDYNPDLLEYIAKNYKDSEDRIQLLLYYLNNVKVDGKSFPIWIENNITQNHSIELPGNISFMISEWNRNVYRYPDEFI